MFGFTKCGKCEGGAFKIQEMSPHGAAYKFYAIQCTACQTPIGVTDYFNVGSLLKKQEKAIEGLQSKLDVMTYTMNQMAHVLNQMMR